MSDVESHSLTFSTSIIKKYFLIDLNLTCIIILDGESDCCYYLIAVNLSFLNFKYRLKTLSNFPVRPLLKKEVSSCIRLLLSTNAPREFMNILLRNRLSSSTTKNCESASGKAECASPTSIDDPFQTESAEAPEGDSNADDSMSVLFVYPNKGRGSIIVTEGDYRRLNEGEYLNDTVIEFYIKWRMNEKYSHLSDSVHAFSSFFYKQLPHTDVKSTGVRNFVSRVPIFSKRYLLMPINESFHWYLGLVCYPSALIPAELARDIQRDENMCYIVIFDSMNQSHYNAIQRLKNFLILEAQNKYGLKADPRAIKSIHAKIPLQTNGSDCGIYMLKYFDIFLSDPEKYFNVLKRDVRRDGEWFTAQEAGLMRKTIMEKMRDLSEKPWKPEGRGS